MRRFVHNVLLCCRIVHLCVHDRAYKSYLLVLRTGIFPEYEITFDVMHDDHICSGTSFPSSTVPFFHYH